MNESILLGLTSIILFGTLAQWIAWKFHLPSILLLLLFGFLIGPTANFLHPDRLFGELLFPIVSLSVAIILFEGGLSLKIKELRTVGPVVRNLVTVGALLSWGAIAAAAHTVLQFDLSLSLLLGAILVVTGPTVILPLLRQMRPAPQVANVLKWEGILIDPVGALLAVLVFEFILAGHFSQATTLALSGLLKTLVFGTLFGAAGAGLIVLLLRQHLMPDYLQNPVSLMIVVSLFAVSNLLQDESGLFTVTWMGILLANQKYVNVKHIVEFKENLRVILISTLFILLSARLDFRTFSLLGWSSVLFLGILIFVVRPLAVFLSTMRSKLSFKERLLVSWMAPRGIVAAAVASVFALYLSREGYANAEKLVAITFFVIVGTITLYGLTALPLSRALKLSHPNPQGVMFLGAHSWARDMATILYAQGIRVLLADNNWRNIKAARMQGLPTYYGNIVSEFILDEIDLTGLGRLAALTSNDEINSLAALYLSDVFGSNEVYQLAPATEAGEEEEFAPELLGRILFGPGIHFSYISERIEQGAEIKLTHMTEAFDYDQYRQHYGEQAVPLFIISEGQKLTLFTDIHQPVPQPGDKLVGLVDEPADG